MTQVNKNGMKLRLAEHPRRKNTGWLIQTLVALLACAGFLATITGLTGYLTHPVMAVMLGIGIYFCAVYGLLLKTDHEGWFYIGSLVLMLLVVLFGRHQVLEGFRIFWNQASDAMVEGTGWVIPEWELQLGDGNTELCLMLFGGLVSCLCTLICCFLTSVAPAVLAVLLDAVLLGGMMRFGADGTFVLLLPVLGVSVMVLMYSGLRKKNAAPALLLGWSICAAAAAALLVITSLPALDHWVQDISSTVHQTIHEKKYETEYSTLPEGDFTDYRNTDRKAQPALAVTMEVPQQMYLRGFTGAEFTGDRWQPLNTDALAENKQLLYWLNLNAFGQNAQFAAAAACTETERSTVTVQNIGACSYYRYVPFSILEGKWVQNENLNTDGVWADGERSYVYSVISGTGNMVSQVLTHLQTSEEPAVLRYRQAESGYRKFIEHYYLQIPESVKEMLAEQWDGIAENYGGADNLTQQQAQACALLFLSQCFTEDGTPEDMELPLENAEGTTYQYATVAAMTLRYFGIPARYAEGYVITEEMAAEFQSGETMTVDSSCAKAWVEVYQDGIGWIPMDLTPGMGEILENADISDQNNDGKSNNPASQKKEEEPEEEETEKPEPTGGTVVMLLLKTILWGLLILLAVWMLIFLILWSRRKILMERKEKKFESGNVSDAVAWIYADTALLLEKLGFNRGNGSMRSLKKSLEEKYGTEFAAQFDAVSDLNDCAMFSSRPMEEEHRKAAGQFRSHVLRKVKSEVKWYKRMWLKWVVCLY